MTTPPALAGLTFSPRCSNSLQRQGAGAVYLNAHHPDIMTFFDTKRENADEKIRIKTLSLGVVIPDITFELAKKNEDMYLFSPYDVERVEGKPFSECSVTENYHKWVDDERITKTKIKARDFFRTISEVQFESGYPYVMFEDTVNRAHTMRHVGKVNMSNLCVTGDTEILTDHGYRKVLDLYNTQEDFNVIVDERARTMNLAAKGTKSVPSTRMFKTAEAADVYRVTTLEGHEIKATEWHKFYVDRDGELVKIPLHELVPGDRLLVQGAESQARGDCHEPDLAYIAGVLAADGTFTNDGAGVRIDLYGDKRQFADGIKSAIHRVLAGRDDLVQRQATLTPEFSERMTMNPKLHLSSAPLAKLLASHGVVRETKVAVPEFVKRGDRETQEAFINGVWQMDGCITGNEKVGNISIELGSIHHDFLREMQKLLLGFGVYSRIYQGKKVGGLALMPDGKGGEDYYYQSRSWTLRAMDRSSREILHDLVVWREEAEAYWRRRCAGIKSDRYYSTHRFRATVERIEFAGVEDVFDPTVDDGHSVIYNGIVTGQCSEILQVNTPSVYHADLGYEVTGNDISCNLGSLNVKKMLDLSQDEFVDTVQVAVRALDQVSRMTSIDSVPSVRKGNEDSRAIGLGQMNLHGALAHHGLRYGSDEALRLWDRYMALVTWAAMLASTEIAREHGETALFEGSDYQTGKWFRDVPQAWLDEHEGDLTILGGLSAPDRGEWQHLALRVSQYGMANAYLQTIPPTGSISYINHSTSSIHPIVSKVEIRKEGRVGRVYYPAPHMRTDNLSLYEDAYEIGPEKIIDTYAVSQYWIDQGQSLTLFFRAEATTRDLDRARIYAWRKGIRTMYYARIRQLAMDGTQVAGTGVDECESCML